MYLIKNEDIFGGYGLYAVGETEKEAIKTYKAIFDYKKINQGH